MEYRLQTQLSRAMLAPLHAGDTVYLSGEIFTARDAAHARMAQSLDKGQPLPFDIRNAILYYAGPTPTPPGAVVGSIGPTTSGRMDAFTPRLLDLGLIAMIGKGARSPKVLESMARHGAVYFGFIGGAGALAARCITQVETVAYADLGSEAVRRLNIVDLPLTVLACRQDNLYAQGVGAYLRSLE